MKIFKKSMCLLLAVVMVLGMAITASAVETTETMSVTASKANPAVGEEFSIYLNASGNIAECGCFQMDLYYDQDLFEYVGANTAFTPNHNTNKTTGARYIRLTWLDLTSQTVIPKGQFCELKFKVLKAGEYHFQLTNIVISDYKGDAIMNVATAPGSVDVAATEAPAFVGYAVSASEDKTVTVGESAEVKINVSNSDSIITTYNAYDLTLTYDTDKLTYNSCTAADALAVVKEDVPGTIRVIGFGDDKNLDTPAATLSFTAKGTGEAEVKITSAKVDIGSQAVGSDAPAAFLLDDTSVIKVTGYTVTLGEGLSGESTVAPGADYTFTAIDADNYDYVISATMGGETTTANDNGNGTYTIPGVTGNLVINATMTPKSYNVTVEGTGAGDVTAADKATYNTDYTFTVTEDGNYTYNTTVTVGGKTYSLGAPENGKYTIPGTDIKGDIVISVTKTVKPSSVVSVTKPDYVKGNDTATKGQDYTFTVEKEDGYDYSEPTVKVGDVDVTDKVVKKENGSYTIPGSTITGNITIEVTKTAAVTVDVTEYITLNGKVMYLVTASGNFAEGQVAKYDGMSMFFSEKYNAYAYLVISADNLETVKAEAAAKVKVAEGTAAGTVDYTGDVNGTKVIDVNDAQLTYDMYNTKYSSFDVVSMLKFLNADVSGDKKVNTADATAIVNLIP
ncbi:MAG: cohesin domain-containing protein [Oscillospiraceae bacterium]